MKKSNSNLKTLVKEVDENFRKGLLIIPELGIKIADEKISVIPTGSRAIDRILGVGGLPKGRIVEILGSESSGKTTLALSVISEAQKQGLRGGYIDTEQALDKKRSEEIGVDFSKLGISQPDNAEQALDLLELMIVSKEFGVIVLDSVAALVPKAELEGDMSDAVIGVQARLMGKILRKITPILNKNKVLMIFINQVRYKIGGFSPFPQEVTSGGNALKFYATVRIDMRRIGQNQSKSNPKSKHKVKIKKNKLAMPGQDTVVEIGIHGFRNEKETETINS
jgi:recombination protein RecA